MVRSRHRHSPIRLVADVVMGTLVGAVLGLCLTLLVWLVAPSGVADEGAEEASVSALVIVALTNVVIVAGLGAVCGFMWYRRKLR